MFEAQIFFGILLIMNFLFYVLSGNRILWDEGTHEEYDKPCHKILQNVGIFLLHLLPALAGTLVGTILFLIGYGLCFGTSAGSSLNARDVFVLIGEICFFCVTGYTLFENSIITLRS